MSQQTAITPTRAQDFPEWYQQVIKAADMAENSEVRGCMVIKPWGYAIWELIQKDLDQRFKDTGHTNAYFPLLIPISYLEKEAEHAEGFATECAVVTHHRLEAQKDELTAKIADEKLRKPSFNADFIRFWLMKFRKFDVSQQKQRKALIEIFVNAIFLYDDRMLITFNYKDGSQTVRFEDTLAADELAGNSSDLSSSARYKKKPR